MFVSESELKELIKKPQTVVIVGAGPAGITIAMELEALGIESLLLEAGGFEFPDEDGRDPYLGEITERSYALSASRLRYFGGTSNHWGGWCRPLDPEDFDKIDGRPLSGWPIDYRTTYQYLDRAHEICEINGEGYDISQVKAIKADTFLPTDQDSPFRTSMFRFSPPTRFGKRYRETIAQSKKIHCALHINLLGIERSEGDKSRLLVKLPSREKVQVNAKAYVLAMGGIENARFLLTSNLAADQPFGSEWNGLCFMEHYGFKTSDVYAKPGFNYHKRETENNGVKEYVKTVIAPSSQQLKKGMLNMMMGLYPLTKEDDFLNKEYAGNKGFTKMLDQGWLYALRTTVGASPTKKSYIALSDEQDIHGVNRIKLNWHVPDEDFKKVIEFSDMFGHYLGYKGFGRLKKINHKMIEPDKVLSTGMHHVGTTRMGSSKATGVVDVNCQLFNSTDVFIAGSSIFPTVGYSNPTLTIVALAVRLAKHLGKIV